LTRAQPWTTRNNHSLSGDSGATTQGEALAKLEELKTEATKGEKRDDGVIAKLIDGLVGLVPNAVSGVVSAFSTPILGAIAGPATKSVLEKIQGW
jgi:hypothetical protein